MARFTGTNQADTISSVTLSRGVVADPTGALPSEADDQIRGLGGADSIDGGGGVDSISGGSGADSITGDGTISGGGGNDVISTTGGADTTVRGGSGNDEINAFSDGPTLRLYGDGGSDRIAVASPDGDATSFVYGGSGNDTLQAAADFNNAPFGAGTNTLDGGTGNDTFIVFQSGDTVVEAPDAGRDTVLSWADFSLPDNVENLTLLSTGYYAYGNEVGTGNGGGNVIRGNTENNRIDGLGGNDTLYGRAPGMEPADIYGDAYEDADTIRGGDGNDRIYGGDGRATWDGDDSLFGDAGGDRLLGGLGADTLSGGPGNDVYQYRRVAESTARDPDTISDFDGVGGGEGDRIDLSSVDANATRGGEQGFTFVRTALTAPGQLHVVEAAGGGGSIVEGEVNGRPGADFVVRVADGAAEAADWVPGDFIL